MPFAPIKQTRRTVAKYLSCADTAKLIRAALKKTFLRVKFSVRSKTYSGGASVTVHWTDGPTAKQVDAQKFLIDQVRGHIFASSKAHLVASGISRHFRA
jgi:Large polyvalent protein associated domain 29